MSKTSNGFFKVVQLGSLEDTQKLAHTLASFLKKRDILALTGDLGAGKTTFARFLIQTLMKSPTVIPSPTFTLVQTYEAENFEIWHFDLYRLKIPEEIFELGIEEAFTKGLTLIEWPEKMEPYFPQAGLKIKFELVDEHRHVLIEGNELWQPRLTSLNL